MYPSDRTTLYFIADVILVAAVLLCLARTASTRETVFSMTLHDGADTADSVWSVDEQKERIYYTVTSGANGFDLVLGGNLVLVQDGRSYRNGYDGFFINGSDAELDPGEEAEGYLYSIKYPFDIESAFTIFYSSDSVSIPAFGEPTSTTTAAPATTTTIAVTTTTTVEPLVADFEGCYETDLLPAVVQFRDTSQGEIATREWFFGDGTTVFDKNPVHTYDVAGSYDVRLRVTDSSGTSDTVTRKDCVALSGESSEVRADFTAEPVNGCAPLTVQFVNLSDGPVREFLWTFGDGEASSTVKDPVYTYNQARFYPVSLTVTGDNNSDIETKLSFIAVEQCMLPCAVSYLLDNDEQKIQLLRRFRDDVLMRSETGRMLVRLYYTCEQTFSRICNNNPFMAKAARLLLRSSVTAIAFSMAKEE